jgi:L-iditol 2-dehydrogenase
MKALVINKPGELQVKDLSTPAIAADEVLVRMRAVGICHSDYELYSGKYIIPIAYPVTPGHEWAGEIVETGKAVGDIKSGDRVVGECVIESGDKIDHFGFSIDGAYSQLFKARPEWLASRPARWSSRSPAATTRSTQTAAPMRRKPWSSPAGAISACARRRPRSAWARA